MRVEEGQVAPDFTLPRDGGAPVRLADFRGRPLVIFVYPQDGSPTCTLQAREFSARQAEIAAAGAAVIGLSPDSVEKHDRFCERQALTVPLIADEERLVIEGWGLWVPKQMFGNKYMGTERTTFLIDAEGVVRKIWRKVRLKNHVDQVIDAIRAL